MRAPFGPLLLASLTAACAAQAPAATPSGTDGPALPARFDAAAIDAYVAAQVKDRKIVGAQLVIARDGEVVLSRAYGLSSLATRAPVTPDTAFGIGSVTKQFICAAALLLEDDGKLSLDDRVAAHYPDLTRAADIRLDDLGGHLSGYPDYYPLDYVDRRMRQPTTPDEVIRKYATGALEFEPRTRYSYSNTGFLVLGRVVEKVSGQTLGDFLRQRVFAPLGMTRSGFGAPGTAGALDQPFGHWSRSLGFDPVRPESDDADIPAAVGPAGNVHATLADYALFMQAHIAGARGVSGLLSADSFQTLQRRIVSNYALGWFTQPFPTLGVDGLTHSGSTLRWFSLVALAPTLNEGVMIATNGGGERGAEAVSALERLLAKRVAASI